MQDFINKKILLGISGGIAAYKSAYLVRELTRLGAEVRVVMTASAQQFITPMTMQALSGADVRCELFDSNAERAMGHIELARWADYLVVAPASAHCLAKMAHGLADDLLSTLYLVAEIPVFVCPAMNKSMWAHPATQHNAQQLTQRGVILIEPEAGAQACGEYGVGRMSETHHIIAALRLYEVRHLLAGHSVLITAGTTHELIDPVRFISNKSSGKMGYALAQAAYMAGAEVTLISGPCALTPPVGVRCLRVTTAREMFDTVMSCLKPGMIFMAAAAVADYAVDEPKTQKLKKHEQDSLTLTLRPNPDILATVASRGESLFVVGFAAETQDVVANARQKLVAKKLDMIIANQVGEGVGFDVDENQVTAITKNNQIDLKKINKTRLAGQLIAIIAGSLQNEAQ